ncbi:dTDP-4-dehydrorhamnose 3,5-epimerase [bacterium]|nr:MAG: dTDP-4-dehydrorhamnose 3,5-epimerase [bacterium]
MRLIDGVKVKKLRCIPDERGRVVEILRCDDEIFERFGQVYMTTAYPGVVKAWHAHKNQDDNIVCVKGMIKLVIYDDREESPTRGMINEFFMGEHNPILVHVPREVWHGFKNIGTEECIVINIPTQPYNHENPDELRRPAHGDIPYDWGRKDG